MRKQRTQFASQTGIIPTLYADNPFPVTPLKVAHILGSLGSVQETKAKKKGKSRSKPRRVLESADASYSATLIGFAILCVGLLATP